MATTAEKTKVVNLQPVLDFIAKFNSGTLPAWNSRVNLKIGRYYGTLQIVDNLPVTRIQEASNSAGNKGGLYFVRMDLKSLETEKTYKSKDVSYNESFEEYLKEPANWDKLFIIEVSEAKASTGTAYQRITISEPEPVEV